MVGGCQGVQYSLIMGKGKDLNQWGNEACETNRVGNKRWLLRGDTSVNFR